jgi:hypothetical protein
LGQFSKNYRTFYQKNCQKALKNMVLGSGIRDPGVKKHPIPDPDPQHCKISHTTGNKSRTSDNSLKCL